MHPPVPPPRPRMSSIRREDDSTPPPPDAGLANVVRLLANEALERSQRDRRMEERAERIANAVEALVAIQRLPPMRPELASQNDVAMEALKLAAEATGRHQTQAPSSVPPFLRDWRGPIKLSRKMLVAMLLAACATAGTLGVGWLEDCQHHAQK